MSQFAFLQAEFNGIADLATRAERAVHADPRAACFYARLTLENAVRWMYRADRSLRKPYDDTLSALIHEPSFRKLVGNGLVTKAKLIKDVGNQAVHGDKPVPPVRAQTAVRELFHFCFWLVRTYARGAKPDAALTFSIDALPRLVHIEETKLSELQAIEKAAEEARRRAEREALATADGRTRQDEEIKALQEEIAGAKFLNAAVPDQHDYDEAQTRRDYIDILLYEAGWPLDQPQDREFPLDGLPTPSGKGAADYVLWGDDGRPLAVVEAKRATRDPRDGQRQAELYAGALEKRYGQRPIIFYTNGFEHWIWDDQRYPPRGIFGFLKKEELALTIQRRNSLRPLTAENINPAIADRHYQTRAIRRVAESFEKDNQRKALLVMATGAGKTRTVIALCDLLMRANWVKRVLFLADRKALLTQASNAFKAHLPNTPIVNLLNDKSGDGRVCLSTYPTMMGLLESTRGEERRFGPGHFDLIVIDEAHRSVYRTYRAIFDYFDSLLVGLTATPKDEITRDTYSLFELERGVPTDAYDIYEAVKDGYLVPPRSISVPLKFERDGITYDNLSDEEKDHWDALEWSEDGEIPDYVEPAALNRWLFNEDTVDKVLAHVMTHGLKVADGGRLGKTIIFAKNHHHAQFIVERFNAQYPKYKGQFARLIDFHVGNAQSLIDDFSVPDKSPHIAVSVDMLDTGIDVPEIVNLVFFKIVRSKTKFLQMIGRGTRLRPDLFGPGRDKKGFLVFDFCQNFEFFEENPERSEGGATLTLGERLFTTHVNLLFELDQERQPLDDELRTLRNDLANQLHAHVASMNQDNVIVRAKLRYVEKFANKATWQFLNADCRLEAVENLASLPSGIVDPDTAARQFDYLIAQTQYARLLGARRFDKLCREITAIAKQLQRLKNIPMIAAEMPLIMDIQRADFWQNIGLPKLEDIRLRLRGLIQLIGSDQRPFIFTNFEDEIGPEVERLWNGSTVGTDMERFKLKVSAFLRENENHITILKVRRNEQLTPQDLEELERIFLEEGIAGEDDLAKLHTLGGLGLFIRKLVGLDREAAKAAFNTFLASHPMSANQIEFVNMIINHLTENGIMDPAQLYQSPFTDFSDLGVEGIFDQDDVIYITEILRTLNKNLAA